MTRRAIITGKRVKFCRVTPKARIQVRVFPVVEFKTVRLAKRAKVMFEQRIREFPGWLINAAPRCLSTKPAMRTAERVTQSDSVQN